jgi:hypothetical protein
MVESKITKTKQVTYLSETEMKLIKDAWSGDDVIIRAFMKFMLQLPLNKDEKIGINRLSTQKEILYVLRKMILPTLDYMDVPMEAMDLRMTGDYVNKTPAEALPFLQSKEIFINYLDQQLNSLEKDAKEEIKLDDLAKPNEDYDIWFVNTITRTSLIQFLKKKIALLENFAGQHTETMEEMLAKMGKNSSK